MKNYIIYKKYELSNSEIYDIIFPKVNDFEHSFYLYVNNITNII